MNSNDDAVGLLQQAFGAAVIGEYRAGFHGPAPVPDELLVGDTLFRGPVPWVAPPEYTEAELTAAGCCGGFMGPGGYEHCSPCPMQRPALSPVTAAAFRFIAQGPALTADGVREIAGDGPLAAKVIEQEVAAGRMIAPAGQTIAPFRAPVRGEPARYSDDLWQELTGVVREYAAADPRSLQTRIGPSEVGHPCDARVLRGALELERINTDADPWASIVGTAVHEWLARAFKWKNEQLGVDRYVVESRVYATDGIYGSCDLQRDGTVIDHKIVGTDTMRALRSADGWSAKGGIYSTQLDLYALGWANAGVEIGDVVIAAWPRSGLLDGLHLLRRPWSRENAERALERLSKLVIIAGEHDGEPEHDDRFWESIPVKPSKQCVFCHWFDPNQDPDVPTALRCGAGRLPRRSQP